MDAVPPAFVEFPPGKVTARDLPPDSLLSVYANEGNYTDCFTVDLREDWQLSDFIGAFFTSWAFWPERLVLRVTLGMRSNAARVAELAAGSDQRFAAWTVELRTENQLLLCDFQRLTRSWLKVVPLGEHAGTRLYFGSAVVVGDRPAARTTFRLLTRFHRFYARLLLSAAARRLQRQVARPPSSRCR